MSKLEELVSGSVVTGIYPIWMTRQSIGGLMGKYRGCCFLILKNSGFLL